MKRVSIKRFVAFTLIELLVVLAIVGLLIALVLPAVHMARAAARRSQCQNNLKQIGIALTNYHASHRVFPPAKINPGSYSPTPGSRTNPVLGGGTKNTTGWLLLLPYLEEGPLYDHYNMSTCSSANAASSSSYMPVMGSDAINSTVVGSLLSLFLCPSDASAVTRTYRPDTPSERHSMNNARPSSYLFSTGAFPDGAALYSVARGSNGQGMFGTNGAANQDEIDDGLAHSIAVGESIHSGGVENFGPWWGAGVTDCCHGVVASAPSSEGARLGSFSSRHPQGAHLLFGDGAVRFAPLSMEWSQLYSLATICGNESAGGL